MKSKRFLWGAVVCVLLAVLIWLIPLPMKIDRELSGMYWKDGQPEVCEACTIQVQGWYYNYLLRDDTFQGMIRISGNVGNAEIKETLSEDNFLLETVFSKWLGYGGRTGSLNLYNAEKNWIEALGTLTVSGGFQELCIQLSSEELISAPAATREEAVSVATKLTSEDFCYQ